MSQADFSPRAVEDLREILEYIARDQPQVAEEFVSTLRQRCVELAQFPRIGMLREDLAPQLRVFPVGNYAIYFRPANDGVRIERVLHAARDVDALFGSQ